MLNPASAGRAWEPFLRPPTTTIPDRRSSRRARSDQQAGGNAPSSKNATLRKKHRTPEWPQGQNTRVLRRIVSRGYAKCTLKTMTRDRRRPRHRFKSGKKESSARQRGRPPDPRGPPPGRRALRRDRRQKNRLRPSSAASIRAASFLGRALEGGVRSAFSRVSSRRVFIWPRSFHLAENSRAASFLQRH